MIKAAILAAVEIGLLLQDAQTQFVVGRVQVNDQPALQARLDALLQILDLARRAVGGNHDLLVLINQRVERVEEFFLRRILARHELHVIDHQHIDTARNISLKSIIVRSRRAWTKRYMNCSADRYSTRSSGRRA